MIKVVLLGSGNIASHLYRVLNECEETEVIQIYNRKIESLKLFEVDKTDDLSKLKEADIYIVCVIDDAIASITSQLPFQKRLVVHTSGSVSIKDISNKNRRGVFYPLQSFSKNKKVDFKSVPICIETENKNDLDLLIAIAECISQNVYLINSAQRKSLHLAAVFVNNFVNHLYQIGNEICTENNVSFKILEPLIKETAEKIVNLPPKEAQTGPAKRNDLKTINNHLNQLKNKTHKEVYTLLTKSIQNTYGRKEL